LFKENKFDRRKGFDKKELGLYLGRLFHEVIDEPLLEVTIN
jgi:hypothetical protein